MSNTNTNLQTQTSNALHNAIKEAGGKDRPPMLAPGINNDIYSTVDAYPNAYEMWKAIERLKQGESINVQDLKTNLYWEFGKFTPRDGESLKSYYSRLQQATRNRGKAIVNSSTPIYDQEPATVTEDDEISKEKEIDTLMALISLSFKKIYKPTNNNLRTSSNTSRANQDNSLRINRGTGYENQRVVNVAGARENVGTLVVPKSGIQCYNCKEYGHLNAEQADWKDDTDDESDDQELEAHYMYMAQIQEVTPDIADISGPIFDTEPLQKVQNNHDNYNVFAIENEHPEQPESVTDAYLEEQGDTNITIDSLDMCYDREQDDQDDADELAQERDLLASLIDKLKCEIDDNNNRNKFLESSHKALVDKLKGEIEDFKTKNKSLESSNNHFKEANNELSKTNQLMFKDLKKFQSELDKYHDVNYASKVAIDCAKAKGDLMSYKIESEKSSNEYTRKINDLNQTISDMKKELFAYQETISIMSREKEAQIKFYKTREDKELDKVLSLENKVKVLDDIVYKTSQSVQTMNMLNRFYNDNPALMLAPESDETIHLDKESTVKFVNDQIAPILGYGDLKSTCYIRDLKGNDLLIGSHGTALYSITLQDTSTPNPICLMAKASSSQAWLWHRRLSHLNFDSINLLLKNDIVIGLLKLKFIKNHLCSSCELGKAKQKYFHIKTTLSSNRRLQLLHMDLCGPMHVESINGKKYVLVIVDDYSRYTWTHFLRSKDETPEVLIDFLRLVQRGLHAQVRTVQTDKGTKFLNKTLHAYSAKEGIRHKTSTARTPKQNGVVERRNRTLVKAARTMLSAAKVPLDGENLDKMKEKDGVSSDPVPQCPTMALEHDRLSPGPQSQENVPQAAKTVTM
ncbi:retrovirus-related pol polyprotein from transposon TNT 1-94 [Tanacetum coccineum]